MRTIFVLLLSVFIAGNVFAQSQQNLKQMADQAVKTFTWDIEKVDKGALMFLDVPYTRDNNDTVEFLSLTVAKDKLKSRPEFISIILPNNVVKTNGVFIKFAKSSKDKGAMELESGNPVKVPFEYCNSSDCTARILDGYAVHENGDNEDIFKKFLDYDHVLFLFIYPDGSHKSVAVPLFSFKQQYQTL